MYGSFAKILTLVILLVLIIIFSINPNTAPFQDDLTFSGVMAAVGAIFIIVLLVERLTEIIITIWRESEAERLKKEAEKIRKDATRVNDLYAKQEELMAHQAVTKNVALLVGFSISVIVCSAGVGLLGAIIDTAKSNTKSFLRGVDILLTSGLIAGGSDSFHQFVSALEAFFNESKKRIENGKK